MLCLLLGVAILLLALVEVEEGLSFLEHHAELLHLVCLLLRVQLPLQGGDGLLHDPLFLLVQFEHLLACPIVFLKGSFSLEGLVHVHFKGIDLVLSEFDFFLNW